MGLRVKPAMTTMARHNPRKSVVIVIIYLLLFCSSLTAQELSGYISAMPSIIQQQPESDGWQIPHIWWQMLVHNRLNFNWQMTEHLRIDAGIRNRFITGSEDMLDPKSISTDMAYFDMSWNFAEGKNALANISFDRLYITFEKNKWKLQVGRQRINWGQTFVWNPNDIFNTYSFFDFDYPERSGCDAFRSTYYHDETSSSELAVSINHDKKFTAALLHRWNSNNIDYQLIVGEQAETDIVIGAALTNDFSGLNLRGELSYFHPIKEAEQNNVIIATKTNIIKPVPSGEFNLDSDYKARKKTAFQSDAFQATGIVAISVGADYIFSNSLMLQTEVLYNNVGNDFSGSGLMGLYAAPLSAKYLSICDWNIFANASYPITPRLNGSLSAMYFVDIDAYYAGLSLDYSVIENLDLSLIAQYFTQNIDIFLVFARLKYSF
jgi:hypothetical protein